MHRDICTAIQQRGFELFNEQPLAPHLGERAVQNLVAACGHAEQFDCAARIQGLEASFDMLGLPQGETAFPGGDDDALRRARSHEMVTLEMKSEELKAGQNPSPSAGICIILACTSEAPLPAPMHNYW